MKTWFVAAASAVIAASLTFAPVDADAKKRFGGGQSSGMQRDMPTRNAPDAPPAKPATPAPGGQPGTAAAPAAAGAAAAGTAAAATKKSWMGPLAGLAAGLGLVALASALGFGEELANFLMLALLGVATLALVLWALRRFGRKPTQPGMTPAYGAAGAGATPSAPTADTLTARTAEPVTGGTQPSKPFVPAWPSAGSDAAGTAAAAATAGVPGAPIAFQRGHVPADFDTAGFERVARMIFIRMQAAHDAADLDDLRSFTTPEMFAAVKVDLQDRVAGTTQHTEVEHVDAEVLDVATEDGRQIVSVRFHGRIREDGEPVEAFDEVWHLVKPVDGTRNWAIAGIQQQPMAV